MKVKLLKKIRKQYSIVYFKKGDYVYGLGSHSVDLYHVTASSVDIGHFFESKNDCLDWIVKDVKRRYGKKQKDQGIKVWYNEKTN